MKGLYLVLALIFMDFKPFLFYIGNYLRFSAITKISFAINRLEFSYSFGVNIGLLVKPISLIDMILVVVKLLVSDEDTGLHELVL